MFQLLLSLTPTSHRTLDECGRLLAVSKQQLMELSRNIEDQGCILLARIHEASNSISRVGPTPQKKKGKKTSLKCRKDHVLCNSHFLTHLQQVLCGGFVLLLFLRQDHVQPSLALNSTCCIVKNILNPSASTSICCDFKSSLLGLADFFPFLFNFKDRLFFIHNSS